MNVKKKLKKHFAEESFSVFKGAPFKPFEHTKTFCSLNVFNFVFNIHKKNPFYAKNIHVIEKNEIFDRKVFKLDRFS